MWMIDGLVWVATANPYGEQQMSKTASARIPRVVVVDVKRKDGAKAASFWDEGEVCQRSL